MTVTERKHWTIPSFSLKSSYVLGLKTTEAMFAMSGAVKQQHVSLPVESISNLNLFM